jgi:uncharacterized LabA/DUF88 family protein/cold shock CspA family protein
MSSIHPKLTKIGVFYDGNYFLHVSNYYNYNHQAKRRISISGLHELIINLVADEESQDPRLCRIVDAHFFRGRLNAYEASQKGNQLYYDRVFDDILMSEGVTTHYMPVKNAYGNRDKEIDISLALEAFQSAIHKQFDVLVLIASDGDYVPLVKKLNSIGTRVMILGWDFEYTNDEGQRMITKTSHDLQVTSNYPVAMFDLINEGFNRNDDLIDRLFVQTGVGRTATSATINFEDLGFEEGERQTSSINSVKSGYGFINFQPKNLFFHFSSLLETDFNSLQEGDSVEFTVATNEKGELVAREVKLIIQ